MTTRSFISNVIRGDIGRHDCWFDAANWCPSQTRIDKTTFQSYAKMTAVRSLKNGKTAEKDNIPVELLNKRGEAVIDILTNICSIISQTGEWPTTWTNH